MSQVVANLLRSLESSPRQVFVAYYSPVVAHLFNEAPFLKKIKTAKTYCVYTNATEMALETLAAGCWLAWTMATVGAM